jgi:hypothetical protein
MFLQFDALLESPLTFPVLECLHIAGFAIGAGTIAAVDFRILELGLQSQKTSALASDLSSWTTFGLGFAVLAGLGMFLGDPDLYYLNPSFQVKMTLLTAALIFHYTVHQRRAYADAPDSKWVAIVSLALWTGIIFSGIFIAFTGELA